MGQPLQLPLDVSDAPSAGVTYDGLREELNKRISGFVDEYELPFGMMALLLIDLGVSSRMIEYLLATAKPSGMGLKLDLDRFRREIDDYIRGCKRDADDFVRKTKDAIAEGLLEETAFDESQGA